MNISKLLSGEQAFEQWKNEVPSGAICQNKLSRLKTRRRLKENILRRRKISPVILIKSPEKSTKHTQAHGKSPLYPRGE